MTQKDRLLDYLKKNGSIQPLEAWTQLGIYRLADVIFRLKKDGYAIETEDMTIKNSWNEEVTFAKYAYKGKSESKPCHAAVMFGRACGALKAMSGKELNFMVKD